jgi:hypothetical protein
MCNYLSCNYLKVIYVRSERCYKHIGKLQDWSTVIQHSSTGKLKVKSTYDAVDYSREHLGSA